jgi:hypothetical protein
LEDEFVAKQAEDAVAALDAAIGKGTPVAYGSEQHLEHNPGRPISWVGTSIAIVGFVIGGIAFPISNPAPNWVIFWVGAAIALVGCFILLFSKTMSTDWY